MTVPTPLDRSHVCTGAQDHRVLKGVEKSEHLNGDLNNTAAMRAVLMPHRDPHFAHRSLAIPPSKDDSLVRSRYRPFLLPDEIQREDWISRLELATATELAHNDIKLRGDRLKVLVLYGSLRQR
jgi:arsenic resistance protein ArsH